MTASKRRLSTVLCTLVLGFLVFTFLAAPHTSRVIGTRVGATYNRTLGFQKVFAIGLPSRTDKRDALVMASSYSEFDIDWSEGVMYAGMEEKAIPEAFTTSGLSGSAIGCWRAHLNVLQTIVKERISSALILEDDGDWDVNVKAQLARIGEGFVELQGSKPKRSAGSSPYGDDWDVLWLGHCHSGPHDDVEHLYYIENDSTTPPLPYRSGWWDNAHMVPEVTSNNTRILFRAGSGMCLWAYAMSYNGARKILSSMSLQGGNGRQIDVEISDMSKSKYLKTYSLYPPIFASHRFAGSMSRDSDIKDKSVDEWHEEYSAGVVYSAVMNVPRLVSGEQDVLSQFPEDTPPMRMLDQSYLDETRGELRRVDLLSIPAQMVSSVNVKGRWRWDRFEQEMMMGI